MKELIKKYQRYVSNLKWHVERNKPTGEELSRVCERITDFEEVVRDLISLSGLSIEERAAQTKEEFVSLHDGDDKTTFHDLHNVI